MTTPIHRFGYAVVRTHASPTNLFEIICVFHSLQSSHEYIDKFAASFYAYSQQSAPPVLLNPDHAVPEWWRGYHLFDSTMPIGHVRVDRVK